MEKRKGFLFQVMLPPVMLLIIYVVEYLYPCSIVRNNKFSDLLNSDLLTGIKLSLIVIPALFLLNKLTIKNIEPKLFSKTDGRSLIIFGLFLYSGVLIFSQYRFGDYRFLFRYMGVPAHIRNNFNDLRVITSAMDCVGAGKDPLTDGNCDPKFIYNYPKIWYVLHYWGIGQKHTIPLAILFISAFLTTLFVFIKKLRFINGIIWSMVIISPPVILSIERCNNDLIIFTLLAISIHLLNKKNIANYWGYLLILFGTFLKLYPVFALVTIFREFKPNRLKAGLFLGIPLIAYAVLFFDELVLVNNRSPRPSGNYAFGALTWLDNFRFYFQIPNSSATELIFGIYGLILLIIAFSIYRSFKKPVNVHNTLNMDAFRIGAGIFIGCFILGNNYDYRLIFLIFCIPQVLEWLKDDKINTTLHTIALISIVLFMQYNFVFKHFFFGIQEFHAKAILSWLVFGYLVYHLMKFINIKF